MEKVKTKHFEKVNKLCKRKLDFIIRHGMNFISENNYEFIESMQRWISRNWQVSWGQQLRIGKIYKNIESRLG